MPVGSSGNLKSLKLIAKPLRCDLRFFPPQLLLFFFVPTPIDRSIISLIFDYLPDIGVPYSLDESPFKWLSPCEYQIGSFQYWTVTDKAAKRPPHLRGSLLWGAIAIWKKSSLSCAHPFFMVPAQQNAVSSDDFKGVIFTILFLHSLGWHGSLRKEVGGSSVHYVLLANSALTRTLDILSLTFLFWLAVPSAFKIQVFNGWGYGDG